MIYSAYSTPKMRSALKTEYKIPYIMMLYNTDNLFESIEEIKKAKMYKDILKKELGIIFADQNVFQFDSEDSLNLFLLKYT